jgi:dTDP-4-dehydrorhamnose reductase
VASWYDFAVAIQDSALDQGLLEKIIPILPIPSSEYPTPAMRPVFSIMHQSSYFNKEHWSTSVAHTIASLVK